MVQCLARRIAEHMYGCTMQSRAIAFLLNIDDSTRWTYRGTKGEGRGEWTIGDAEYRGLCRALGRPDLQDDPRFAEAGARARNFGALHEIVTGLVATMPTDALAERLQAEDVPHAVVTPLDRLHEHPQVVANRLLREDVHPLAGPMRSPEPVGTFGGTPLEIERLAPTLGQHTDEVLAELGVDTAEIAALRSDEVVA